MFWQESGGDRRSHWGPSAADVAVYARLDPKAVDRALEGQADGLCGSVQEPVVLVAWT